MKYFTLICFLCLSISNAFTNNVTVENISLTGQNTVSDYKFVELDISWDNSWRTSASPNNWDAVWLFCKYRLTSGSAWNHATLNTTGSNHVAASGSTISPSSDGLGVFLYRSADGVGNVDYDNVQLRWEYGTDGLADNDSVEICVYAIEMVYVPQGDFYIGDGNGTTESNQAFHMATNNAPVQITTALLGDIRTDGGVDDAQLTGASSGIGIDGDDGIDTDDDGTVDNANFPTGYEAFYIMKYELSQGQYADYLNKLTNAQAANRYYSTASYRETLDGSVGNYYATSPNRAMNYTDWPDLCAFADWSGLRPMTELEYEKSSRGTVYPVYQEYAWGTTDLHAVAYTINLDGTGSAVISNMGAATGNAFYATTEGSINGPTRNGIFAASSANHTRIETGGSYYGIMELSGNLYEFVVSLGRANGRAYDGSHGDGELSPSGYANEANWPGLSSGQVTSTTASQGFGLRGGSWNVASVAMQTSYRAYMNTSYSNTNSYYCSIRVCRTAP